MAAPCPASGEGQSEDCRRRLSARRTNSASRAPRAIDSDDDHPRPGIAVEDDEVDVDALAVLRDEERADDGDDEDGHDAGREPVAVRVHSPSAIAVTVPEVLGHARDRTDGRQRVGEGSRGSPSSRSPMMVRWIWLVPPAMRPAGAASTPSASGPSSRLRAPGDVGSSHGDVVEELGDRRASSASRPRTPRDPAGDPGRWRRGPRHEGARPMRSTLRPTLPRPSTAASSPAIAASRRSREITEAPMCPRSFVSTAMPTPHPPWSGPSRSVAGHGDVGEEHLVELGVAGHLAQRPHLDAGSAHVEQEERDAPVASAPPGRCGP